MRAKRVTPDSGLLNDRVGRVTADASPARDHDAADLARENAYLRAQLDQLAGEQVKADSQLSRLRNELRQRKQGYELLSKLFASLDVNTEISAIYARVCQQSCVTLKMDRALVLVPTGAPDEYRPSCWNGFSVDSVARLSEQTIRFPDTFLNKRGVILVTRDSRKGAIEEELRVKLEIPFVLALPIVGSEGVASILVVGRQMEAKPFYPPLDTGDVNTLQAITGFVAAAIQNTSMYQLEKRELFVRDTFGRYLSDDIVRQLLGAPAGLSLGGESRTVTILMSDLRGFTQLSEGLTPAEVVSLLNNYLGAMTDVIQRHHGTIDEFIGDAIMVIFGAPVLQPDHAARAVACALEMQLAMDDVNAWNRNHGLREVEMGIGINTGEVIVGNIGSQKRAKYGVVGRTVNVASRVESYTVGGQVLISEATRYAVGAPLRIDGEIQARAKGVEEILTIYEIGGIGRPYGIELPSQDTALVELSEPIGVCCAPLDGKHSTRDMVEGRIVRLSPREAEIAGSETVPPMTNLVLRLAAGPVQNVDFYARSVARPAGGGDRFIVRLMSLPDVVRAALGPAARR